MVSRSLQQSRKTSSAKKASPPPSFLDDAAEEEEATEPSVITTCRRCWKSFLQYVTDLDLLTWVPRAFSWCPN
ncbi:hypothetical protein RchiOBHm_Chr5g0050601 [Rosa chinensis]|uniref:Uncharacterized protein n=1 Tax=Rosa chinensis TaxID=74649 RepID=A0A2P6QF47_ROSCH|nr:hypothetical protein RchiOBHm_Chr5g0050601 [Rosa chinensis]